MRISLLAQRRRVSSEHGFKIGGLLRAEKVGGWRIQENGVACAYVSSLPRIEHLCDVRQCPTHFQMLLHLILT